MASNQVLEFTDSNFDNEVVQSSVPVLVDFWAEWCAPCRALAPTIDEIAEDFGARAKIGKVDTDGNREVSVKYGIAAIPTVLLFQNGEVKKKWSGLTKKDEFVSAINELTG